MSDTAVITDAEVIEPGAEIAHRDPQAGLAVTAAATAGDLVTRLATIREAMDQAMTVDVDYGVIPGSPKPCLFKPGAEKLAVLFQLDVQTTIEERHGPGDHLTVAAKAIVYHAPTGMRIGSGEGMCSTREKKYAYRRADRVCPECANPSIFKSKKAGEGFYCWSKKGGCGAQFQADDDRITGQVQGDVDNPELPDLWNTVIKMARKRANVDAILLVTGASALFTQDVEDLPKGSSEPAEASDPFGAAAGAAQVDATRKALAYLLDPETPDPASNRVGLVLNEIEGIASGYLPNVALRAIVLAAIALRAKRETTDAGDGDPAGETPEERADRERAEATIAQETNDA